MCLQPGFRWLVGWICGSLIHGCGSSLSVSQKRDAAYLLGEPRTTFKHWRLMETYDPYRGGTTTTPDPHNPTYLLIRQDGEFITYNRQTYSAGTWELQREEAQLALIYCIQNNHKVDSTTQDHTPRYQIQYHSPDSLVLGVQGRHGIVQMRYRHESVSR